MTFDPRVRTAQRNYGLCGISNLLVSWEGGSSISVAPAGRCWAYPTARASGWDSLRQSAGALRFEASVAHLIRRRLRRRLQEPEDTPERQDHVKDGTCGSQHDQGFHWLSLLGRSAGGVGVSRLLRLIGMSRAEARTFTDRSLATRSGLRLAMACIHVSPSCPLLPTNPARPRIHGCPRRNAGRFAGSYGGRMGRARVCSNGATDVDAMPRNQKRPRQSKQLSISVNDNRLQDSSSSLSLGTVLAADSAEHSTAVNTWEPRVDGVRACSQRNRCREVEPCWHL